MTRQATVSRTTKETDISVEIDLDGAGASDVKTGVAFFDHMLDAFARHGMFDLKVRARGDVEVDAHHTVEDVGIVLGAAVARALGDKRGINRFGQRYVPMDEALVLAVVDVSGRGQLHFDADLPFGCVGTFDTAAGQGVLHRLPRRTRASRCMCGRWRAITSTTSSRRCSRRAGVRFARPSR